jgi:hypothetical protein
MLFTAWLAAALLHRVAASPLRDAALLTEVQRRACRFFIDETDPTTGLTKDRASNTGPSDKYTVGSIASTGYALASLPAAVSHHWIARSAAYERALTTLRYVDSHMTNEHGFYYHFVDIHSGKRVWNCEVSTIDTALLVAGALSAGSYWHGTEVDRLASRLYARMDWTWARTNGGALPEKLVVSMGWNPEHGFLAGNWDRYCELMLIYLLGLGAPERPLPAAAWSAWTRNMVTRDGITTLAAGPIFMHEMTHGFYDFSGRRDREGWSYYTSSVNAVAMQRKFCTAHAAVRKTYAAGFWGLNASDGPDGYSAYGSPQPEDGTVSPTGAIAAILFNRIAALQEANALAGRADSRLWGRYGFADAFNVDRDWVDPDVIGIDLGMAALAIEDSRTGMPWRLLASRPETRKAFERAGFRQDPGPAPRPLSKPGQRVP